MYARVLRKWSLYTKLQMPVHMWPMVVKMLLLGWLASTGAAVALALAPTAAAASAPAGAAFSPLAMSPLPLAQQLTYAGHPSFPPAATQPPSAQVDSVGGTIEESFFIPVADTKDSRDAVLSNIFKSRLSGSSSSDSDSLSSSTSSNSISRLFSRSKFSDSNSDPHRKQQPKQEQQPPQLLPWDQSEAPISDGMAYSYFRRAGPPLAPTQRHFVRTQSMTTAPTAASVQVLNQKHNIWDGNDDEDDDDEDGDDDTVEADEVDSATDMESEVETDIESDTEADEDDIDGLQYRADDTDDIRHDNPQQQQQQMARAHGSEQLLQQQYPKSNSLFNLFNTKVNSNKEVRLHQQYANGNDRLLPEQQPQRLWSTNGPARSLKARRHVREQQQTQQHLSPHYTTSVQHASSPLHQQHQSISATLPGPNFPEAKLVWFVNSRNETRVVRLLPSSHYRIEAFEIPSALPNRGELTAQQRRFLLHQQHLDQQQLQQEQEQAARNRRDSRIFGSGNTNAQPQNAAADQHKLHQSQYQHSRQPNKQQRQRQRQRDRDRQRRRPRRYCSARDPAQLAFEAPIVFEGKITSMSSDRRQNFSASAEVVNVYKQQFGYHIKRRQLVRLQFSHINKSGECDIYREQLRPRGLVHGDVLQQQRTYVFFVRQVDVSNFTILGQPIRSTSHVKNAIARAVREDYAQLASIRTITTNRTMEIGSELHIVCKVQGRPPPKVTWFKDGKSINRNRKLYKFKHYKKRSELIIRSFNISDTGRYECRAKNKINQNQPDRRTIMVKADPVPRYATSLTGGTGNVCPDNAAGFCLNGGTCNFFSEIGSYSCICPEGFMGERCDRKEVNNISPSTYRNEQECGEKKFYGSYYC